MATNPSHSRGTIQDTVVEKALSDKNFQKKLLSDPKAAISELLTDVDLPTYLSIRVVQEKENEAVIVLPHVPRALSEYPDLKDRFEEQVEAGSHTCGIWTGCWYTGGGKRKLPRLDEI